MKKPTKKIRIILLSIIFAITFIFGTAFLILAIRTNALQDDYSFVYRDESYAKEVYIGGIEPITQSISCGYAAIEMFSMWNGGNITEENLYNEYGKVVTSTGKSFCSEFNKQFPEYETQMFKYLKNSELIAKVYESLSQGIPVPFEWAALYENEWTLHYSIVIGMDIPNDTVTVANPYGYLEKISLEDFLNRTSFEAFEDMPFFYKLGFAFGVFEKNTIFIASKV
ncbi:MAG: hypothetical protein HDT37_07930 [Clostridiales bacterium]|nr:hypothetical protein [Clostridiales bacterium]